MKTGRSTPGLAAKQRPSRPKFRGVSNNGVSPKTRGQQSRQPTLISRSSTPGASPAHGTLMSPQEKSVLIMKLTKQGRQAFQEKKFDIASSFFGRALAFAPKDVDLLDSRAETYEKLNRLDDALTDAKAMIKRHPQNPKVCTVLSWDAVCPHNHTTL